MNELEKIKSDPISRRSFLATMGAAGLGMAAISLLNGCGGGSNGGATGGAGSTFPISSIPGRNVNEQVLNFALTLETLEADLYRQALNLASGLALTTPLAASPDAYTRTVDGGGLDGFNTQAGFAYIRDFAFVEDAHAKFLMTALAGAPMVQRNPKGYRFAGPVSPNIKAILEALLPLEETGVRAYLGAAPFLTDLNIAQIATGIYSTEARHSSAIRVILDQDPGPVFMTGDRRVATFGRNNTFEYFLTPSEVVNRITPLIVP